MSLTSQYILWQYKSYTHPFFLRHSYIQKIISQPFIMAYSRNYYLFFIFINERDYFTNSLTILSLKKRSLQKKAAQKFLILVKSGDIDTIIILLT